MHKLAEILEREGGRIIAAYALLAVACAWALFHGLKADDLMTAALTLIAREFYSNGGGQKPNGQTPVVP